MRKQKHLESTDTIVGKNSSVTGDISTKSSLRIDGKITGNIEAEGDVVVGVDGEAISDIKARIVVIAGTVQGAVHAAEMLTITETGKLHGDIHTKALSIATGGQFEGTSKMTEASDKAAEKTAEKDQKPHLHKVDGKSNNDNLKKAANAR